MLYRCGQLKEAVRELYRLACPAGAPAHLDWWLAWACRSRILAFLTPLQTVRANRERILAAVELACPTPNSRSLRPSAPPRSERQASQPSGNASPATSTSP